jgi:hypothetical protein
MKDELTVRTSWFRHLAKFAEALEEKKNNDEDYSLELDLLLGWISSATVIADALVEKEETINNKLNQ